MTIYVYLCPTCADLAMFPDLDRATRVDPFSAWVGDLRMWVLAHLGCEGTELRTLKTPVDCRVVG